MDSLDLESRIKVQGKNFFALIRKKSWTGDGKSRMKVSMSH